MKTALTLLDVAPAADRRYMQMSDRRHGGRNSPFGAGLVELLDKDSIYVTRGAEETLRALTGKTEQILAVAQRDAKTAGDGPLARSEITLARSEIAFASSQIAVARLKIAITRSVISLARMKYVVPRSEIADRRVTLATAHITISAARMEIIFARSEIASARSGSASGRSGSTIARIESSRRH
jgi:hypothetical protein